MSYRTARDNRLLKFNSFKKNKRWTYEYYDGNILTVKWNNDNTVTLCTNYETVNLIVSVER